MTLKVIGSGFGRTGTMTMKQALGTLGFGPTHHMTEVMAHPEQLAHWKSIFAGQEVDWAEVYDGYGSQVDWPGASVWQEASIAFPDAKVIHTERPEDDWWASFNGTIGKYFALMDTIALPPHLLEIFEVTKAGLIEKTFADFTDRDSAIASYRANNARVREIIPADRLLVFNVADGWEPLCRFLDVPVPNTPFPRSHARDEFWAHFGGEPETPAPQVAAATG
ncbi:sulfotransferase family protein [Roseovarius sp. D0-M9]|uniref:sulfotransferase family protein n=1 Tax=Roseovarius sp. D0-M9 TaxID=3127117 RepID=UPI003010019A